MDRSERIVPGDANGFAELLSAARDAATQLEHDGRSDLAIRLLKGLLKGLLKAGGVSCPDTEAARLRAALAGMIWKRGEMAKARALAADALKIAERDAHDEARSEALFVLGEVAYIEAAYMGRASLDDALEHHERALELRRRIGDHRGESLSLSRIGVIHERMDEPERARACYEEALRIAEESDFPEGMSRPYVHIGVAKELAGDMEGALADYRRSVAAVRRAHDVHALSFDLCNVASAGFRVEGDLHAAIELLREAREYAEGMRFELANVRVHQVTGDVYAAAGRPGDARQEYEAAIAIADAADLAPFAAYVREKMAAIADESE